MRVGYLQLSTTFPNDSIDYTVIDGSSIGSTYIEGHGIKIKHSNIKACYLINYTSTLSILNSKFNVSSIDNQTSNSGTMPALQINNSTFKLDYNIETFGNNSSIEMKNSVITQAGGNALYTNHPYSKIFLDNVTIRNAGGNAILTSSDHSEVVMNNSSITYCSGSGIRTDASYSQITVTNSIISNNGIDGIFAQGGFSPITVEHSEIINNNGYGIFSYSTGSVNQVIQSIISGNTYHGIYLHPNSTQAIILNGSIVSKNGQMGIYGYNSSVFAENSITSENNDYGICSRTINGNYLTSIYNSTMGVMANSPEKSYLLNSIVCLNNKYGTQFSGNFEFSYSKISGDPKLADSLGHLLPNSPCVDAADPTDEDTNIPFGMGTIKADMGAYGGPDNWVWGGSPIPANGEPDIVKIVDLPQDQGKKVGIQYKASLFDNGHPAYNVSRYSFWRELDENGKQNIVASITPTGQYFQKGAQYWEYVGEMPAMGFQNYGYSAPTLGDSTINGIFWSKFIVVAHTANTSVYWVSLPDSGYSVDNLAPAAPLNLAGTVAGTSYKLQWTPSPEQDFQYYAVYRSTDGIFGDEPFATTTQAVLPDIALNTDEYKYAVVAFDHSGNRSNFSNQISAPIYDAFAIPQGWSGISSWIMPTQPAIENVLAPLSEDLIILYNQSGVYWPGQNVNTLGNWESHSGYVVKLGSEKSLPVVGFREQNTVFATNTGWQILPVLSQCAVPTAGLINQPASNIVMIKEIAGWRVFWPEMGIATLGELLPGKAYFVLTGSVGNIEFPDCGGLKSGNLTGLQDQSGYKNLTASPDLSAFGISNTPVTHIIAVPAVVTGNLETGDAIAVFNSSGACAGAISIQDRTQASALTVFGDDPTTAEKEGLADGETLHFKVNKSGTGTFADAEVLFEPTLPNSTGTFATNGISAIASLKVGSLSTSQVEIENIQVFPNPGSGKFTVAGISKGNLLEVTDAKGQIIWTGISETETVINLSGKSSGLYFLKISRADKASFVKLVIE